MQKQLRRPSSRAEETSEETSPAVRAEADDVLADIDSLLDEIDEVLEQNAEAFIKGYIQRGGE